MKRIIATKLFLAIVFAGMATCSMHASTEEPITVPTSCYKKVTTLPYTTNEIKFTRRQVEMLKEAVTSPEKKKEIASIDGIQSLKALVEDAKSGIRVVVRLTFPEPEEPVTLEIEAKSENRSTPEQEKTTAQTVSITPSGLGDEPAPFLSAIITQLTPPEKAQKTSSTNGSGAIMVVAALAAGATGACFLLTGDDNNSSTSARRSKSGDQGFEQVADPMLDKKLCLESNIRFAGELIRAYATCAQELGREGITRDSCFSPELDERLPQHQIPAYPDAATNIFEFALFGDRNRRTPQEISEKVEAKKLLRLIKRIADNRDTLGGRTRWLVAYSSNINAISKIPKFLPMLARHRWKVVLIFNDPDESSSSEADALESLRKAGLEEPIRISNLHRPLTFNQAEMIKEIAPQMA